ncbi:hypothetical protein MKEN_00530200 [Mycena kentingensis (nom. inval.)]|nr:hypothetical protein MKEN_00530200 [Mycena kentingensis (nom. inval.)]
MWGAALARPCWADGALEGGVRRGLRLSGALHYRLKQRELPSWPDPAPTLPEHKENFLNRNPSKTLSLEFSYLPSASAAPHTYISAWWAGEGGQFLLPHTPSFNSMSALPVPALPPLDSTYGVWLVALLLESILYGMGLVQAWMYFMSMPTDSLFVQLNVLSVVIIETLQVIFFFHASYHRFVHRFAVITVELLWFDSVRYATLSSSSPLTHQPKLQLICAYLGAFLVQIFFAVRVFKLARGSGSTMAILAMYTIFALAIASIGTGIAQTAWTGAIGSFAELGKTKAVTTVQAATSLACDFLITVFLCLFLTSQKGEIKKTNYLLERLIFEAINRGILTALSSGVNLVLFLAIPDTFLVLPRVGAKLQALHEQHARDPQYAQVHA